MHCLRVDEQSASGGGRWHKIFNVGCSCCCVRRSSFRSYGKMKSASHALQVVANKKARTILRGSAPTKKRTLTSVDSTQMFPPIKSTNFLQMERPSPVPP